MTALEVIDTNAEAEIVRQKDQIEEQQKTIESLSEDIVNAVLVLHGSEDADVKTYRPTTNLASKVMREKQREKEAFERHCKDSQKVIDRLVETSSNAVIDKLKLKQSAMALYYDLIRRADTDDAGTPMLDINSVVWRHFTEALGVNT